MAYASRGFFSAGAAGGDTSVVGVMGLGRIVGLVVIFAENGLGDDIFLGVPVTEVAHPATFAAKRKILVHLGIRGRLANRASMLHFRSLFWFGPCDDRFPSQRRRVHRKRTLSLSQYSLAAILV